MQTRRANSARWRSANRFQLNALELDVTDDASIERALAEAIAQTGRIDVLINNAGYALFGLAEAATLEQAKRIIDTNFLGVVRMNRAVLPHMRRQGSGLLLHIGTGAGRVGVPGLGLYSASKFALEALAEAYRYELASQGIESVIVEPGAYVTAVFDNREEAIDQSRTSTYGAANEIPKRVLAALASSKASPQEVVDSVVDLVELPAGNRPLRIPIGLPAIDGFGGLNYISEQLLKNFLDMIGVSPLVAFQAHGSSTD